MNTEAGHARLSRFGQLVPLIAHVDHCITLCEQRAEDVKRCIHWLAGGYEQDHAARRDERRDKCPHIGVHLERQVALAFRPLDGLLRLRSRRMDGGYAVLSARFRMASSARRGGRGAHLRGGEIKAGNPAARVLRDV